jgi:hypothetical protein
MNSLVIGSKIGIAYGRREVHTSCTDHSPITSTDVNAALGWGQSVANVHGPAHGPAHAPSESSGCYQPVRAENSDEPIRSAVSRAYAFRCTTSPILLQQQHPRLMIWRCIFRPGWVSPVRGYQLRGAVYDLCISANVASSVPDIVLHSSCPGRPPLSLGPKRQGQGSSRLSALDRLYGLGMGFRI